MQWTLLLLAGLVNLAASATLVPTLLPDLPVNTTANATVDDCDDDPNGDCWTRPDADCFGIYDPWSHVHCPLRCGFCPGKFPACEDKLPYCDRFEQDTCLLPNYRIWARNNCRKHCNLCAVPTRPPGSSNPMTGGGGSSISVPGGQGFSTPSVPADGNVTMPGMMNTTTVKPTAGTPPRNSWHYGHWSAEHHPAAGTLLPGMCLYHGKDYKEEERWNDGCTYECSCMDAAKNLVVCTERCTRWKLTPELTACKLVTEDNECCARLECNN